MWVTKGGRGDRTYHCKRSNSNNHFDLNYPIKGSDLHPSIRHVNLKQLIKRFQSPRCMRIPLHRFLLEPVCANASNTLRMQYKEAQKQLMQLMDRRCPHPVSENEGHRRRQCCNRSHPTTVVELHQTSSPQAQWIEKSFWLLPHSIPVRSRKQRPQAYYNQLINDHSLVTKRAHRKLKKKAQLIVASWNGRYMKGTT